MDHTTYALPQPYPTVDQVHPNRWDLCIAQNLYAGQVSEYTAIAQYVYHHLYARQEGLETVERELLGIAIVEMRHLALLGGLILQLGGVPRFVAPSIRGPIPWNGTWVDYGCAIKEMILLDIKSEQQAICDYLQGAKEASQPEMAALLLRISQDEELHLKRFTQMLELV